MQQLGRRRPPSEGGVVTQQRVVHGDGVPNLDAVVRLEPPVQDVPRDGAVLRLRHAQAHPLGVQAV
eukprot:CAMPEP_0171185264 /NCGR_PEP_ID=MMETSP0790-20130122/16212_1 /TAXON_ID=2925 /ORGANISM="Alexandrium catenella, Strain OF101" /LENGTH=65 /DNA_ID=CAMNT_0011650281 /DNA_START=45 /DNA_END=242 /DNA_ORIENTATION=+